MQEARRGPAGVVMGGELEEVDYMDEDRTRMLFTYSLGDTDAPAELKKQVRFPLPLLGNVLSRYLP